MGKLENYSVIMSIYDKVNPEHLKISMESIINQTHRTNEFILIKDGPLTPEQESVINKIVNDNKKIFKIHIFDINKGAGPAYNTGIDMCTNEWAAIMDSDDYAIPTKFEKQMKFLNEHKNIDAIGSNAIEFIDTVDNIISTRIMPEGHDEIVKFAHGRCPMIQPTVIFRVSAVKKSGSYQKSQLTEDYDLYIRMIQNGCKFYTCQEILYYVRTGADFYKRRGGFKYLKPILSFKYRHFKNGFFSLSEFIKTFSSSLLVAIIPNFARKFIYRKFLRN